jgi:hypothetical protein
MHGREGSLFCGVRIGRVPSCFRFLATLLRLEGAKWRGVTQFMVNAWAGESPCEFLSCGVATQYLACPPPASGAFLWFGGAKWRGVTQFVGQCMGGESSYEFLSCGVATRYWACPTLASGSLQCLIKALGGQMEGRDPILGQCSGRGIPLRVP